MAKWILEPGHTAAEFSAGHMMVSYVRGAFKNLHGTMDLDLENPAGASVEVEFNASELWTGMQVQYDLWQASKKRRRKLGRLTAP